MKTVYDKFMFPFIFLKHCIIFVYVCGWEASVTPLTLLYTPPMAIELTHNTFLLIIALSLLLLKGLQTFLDCSWRIH